MATMSGTYGGRLAHFDVIDGPKGFLWVILDHDPGFGPTSFPVSYTADVVVMGGDPRALRRCVERLRRDAELVGAGWYDAEADRLEALAVA